MDSDDILTLRDIEELESKIAPDGGETVLPLPLPKRPHR